MGVGMIVAGSESVGNEGGDEGGDEGGGDGVYSTKLGTYVEAGLGI